MVGNWYRGVYVDKETYFNAINKIAGLHHQVAIYFQIHPAYLRWYHFRQYAENVLNFDIVCRDFGRVSSNIVSGMLYSNCGTVAIGVNTNGKINIGRQHFTMMHELSHGIAHVNGNIQTQSFKDLVSSSNYSKEDIIIENEADFCASIMMISDEALEDAITLDTSFEELCFIFEASKGCVNTRLFNYLIYNLGLPNHTTRTIINKFRYNNESLGSTLFYGFDIDINNNFRELIGDSTQDSFSYSDIGYREGNDY